MLFKHPHFSDRYKKKKKKNKKTCCKLYFQSFSPVQKLAVNSFFSLHIPNPPPPLKSWKDDQPKTHAGLTDVRPHQSLWRREFDAFIDRSMKNISNKSDESSVKPVLQREGGKCFNMQALINNQWKIADMRPAWSRFRTPPADKGAKLLEDHWGKEDGRWRRGKQQQKSCDRNTPGFSWNHLLL